MDLRKIMEWAPVIPVLVVHDVGHAQPLARSERRARRNQNC